MAGTTNFTNMKQEVNAEAKTSTEKDVYACWCCSFTTDKSVILSSHMRTHIEEKPVFMCPRCPFTASRPSHVVMHMRVHASDRHGVNTRGMLSEMDCLLTTQGEETSSEDPLQVATVRIENEPICKTEMILPAVDVNNDQSQVDFTGLHSGTNCEFEDMPEPCGKRSKKIRMNSQTQFEQQPQLGRLNHNRASVKPRVKKKCLNEKISGTDSNFTCQICEKKCLNQRNLQRHILLHKKNERTCSDCGFVCEKPWLMRIHMRTHTSSKSISCDYCSMALPSRKDKRKHMEFYHKDKRKPFSCTECFYSCDKEVSLRKHHLRAHSASHDHITIKLRSRAKLKINQRLNNKSAKKFVCSTCGYATPYRTNYLQHLRVHTGDRPYSCDLCDYKAAQSSSVKIHMRKHTREKPFQCLQCHAAFNSSSNLSKHLRIHKPMKSFQCGVCGRGFNSKHNMLRHEHSHSITHKCDKCSQVFLYSCALKSHLKTHRNETSSAKKKKDITLKHKRSGRCIHKCEKCCKNFLYPSALKIHQRSHENETTSVMENEKRLRSAEIQHASGLSRISSKLTRCFSSPLIREIIKKSKEKNCGGKDLTPVSSVNDSTASESELQVAENVCRINVFDLFSPLIKTETDPSEGMENHSTGMEDSVALETTGIKTRYPYSKNFNDSNDKAGNVKQILRSYGKESLRKKVVAHRKSSKVVEIKKKAVRMAPKTSDCPNTNDECKRLNQTFMTRSKMKACKNAKIEESVVPANSILLASSSVDQNDEQKRPISPHTVSDFISDVINEKKNSLAAKMRFSEKARKASRRDSEDSVSNKNLNEVESAADDIKHQASVDNGNVEVLTCLSCGLTCESKKSLRSHMKIHKLIKAYTCSLCNESFPFKATLRKHKKDAHPESCKLRRRIWKQPYSDISTQSTSHNRNAVRKQALVKKQAERLNLKAYTCDVCNNSFPFKAILRKHERDAHPENNSPKKRSRKKVTSDVYQCGDSHSNIVGEEHSEVQQTAQKLHLIDSLLSSLLQPLENGGQTNGYVKKGHDSEEDQRECKSSMKAEGAGEGKSVRIDCEKKVKGGENHEQSYADLLQPFMVSFSEDELQLLQPDSV